MSTRKPFERVLDHGVPKEAVEILHELLDAHPPEEIEDSDEDAEGETNEERDGEANPDEA